MSTIPDARNAPQEYLQWLEIQQPDKFRGENNPKLNTLTALLKGKLNIDGVALTEKQIEKLLAYYLPDQTSHSGAWFGSAQDGERIEEAINKLINTGQGMQPPVISWNLKDFILLLDQRIDKEIIDTYKWLLSDQNDKRDRLRNELSDKTAELKIYGVIQSEINKKLSSGDQKFNTGFQLIDHQLFGYVSQADFHKSAEYKLLSKMTMNDSVTVKNFLESNLKESGAMSGVESEYAYDKDNNKLGNFSTSVSDRSRPVNDKVNEITTRLNDVSSRYNSVIEALSRFIQKFDNMLQEIIRGN